MPDTVELIPASEYARLSSRMDNVESNLQRIESKLDTAIGHDQHLAELETQARISRQDRVADARIKVLEACAGGIGGLTTGWARNIIAVGIGGLLLGLGSYCTAQGGGEVLDPSSLLETVVNETTDDPTTADAVGPTPAP